MRNVLLHLACAIPEEQSYCLPQSFVLNCLITQKNVAFWYSTCQSINKNSFLVLIALIFIINFPSSSFREQLLKISPADGLGQPQAQIQVGG